MTSTYDSWRDAQSGLPFGAFPSAAPRPQCPATRRHVRAVTGIEVGVQCKFTPLHDGDHAGSPGCGDHDIFWPQSPVADPGSQAEALPQCYGA